MTKEQILHSLRLRKEELNKRFGVRKMALFGSYARDEATDESDIDLLVEMEPSAQKFFSLQRYLEELFDKPVDVGTKLRRFVAKRIEKEMITV